MENSKFKASGKKHKAIAIVVTAIFHIALFGSLTMGSSFEMDKMVPQKVKQWFDKDAAQEKPVKSSKKTV